MEKNRIASFLVSFIINFLGLTASGLCVAAEFKRSKVRKMVFLIMIGTFTKNLLVMVSGDVVFGRRRMSR